MRVFLVALSLFITISANAQETARPLTKRVIVKTNVLSLIAQRPTITVEKVFSKNFSAEASFVQGQFNNLLFTDHYDYNGFLVRAKKYLIDLNFGAISPYAAIYLGNLKRTIQTAGQIDNTGWFGYPSRNFSANSIRCGGSAGFSYISKSKIIVDGLASLGYGRYTKIYKPDSHWAGYLDAQLWISIGYCF